MNSIVDRFKRLVGKEIYSDRHDVTIGQKGGNVGWTFTKDLTEQICNNKGCTVEELKEKYKGKVKLWLDYEDGELYIIYKITEVSEDGV